MDKPFYIVAGGGRSGTSLTTMLLHKHGINMGDNMKGVGRFNKTGYYEDYDILYLTYKHLVYYSDQDFDHYKDRVTKYEKLISDMRYPLLSPMDILCDKLRHGLEGFKCVMWMQLCFNDWIDYIPNFKLIITTRNEKPHAASYNKALQRGTEEDIIARLHKHYKIIDEMSKHPKCIDSIKMPFDYWFKEGCAQYQHLCQFIEAEPDQSIKDLINPNERHFK